jgi:MoxR-like ATPase
VVEPRCDQQRSDPRIRGHADATGYLSDEALATVTWLALRLGRPLLMEGEPGTGKTALAEALAQTPWTCRSSASSATRASTPRRPSTTGTSPARSCTCARSRPSRKAPETSARSRKSLFDERFLLARPVLRALRESPAVLLIDEIDRADDEFEAFLLEVLSTWQVTIPELGTVTAAEPPVVVLTSNRTRELHDALKRRCLYHWLEHPGSRVSSRSCAAAPPRCPRRSPTRSCDSSTASAPIATELLKPPGVAETLDWARALTSVTSPRWMRRRNSDSQVCLRLSV